MDEQPTGTPPESGIPPEADIPQELRELQEPRVEPTPILPSLPHRGPLILVLGILGIVCCVICGIVAWAMANNDLRQMDTGLRDPAGRGLTQAGKICGIVSVVLAIVGFVLGLLMSMLGIFAAPCAPCTSY